MKKTIFNTCKITFASVIAILVAYFLDLDFYIACGIVTILTIQSTKKDTMLTAIERFIAFVIALIISYISFFIFDYSILGFSVYLFIYILLCQHFGWYPSMAMNSVLISHFLTFQQMNVTTIMNELALFIIGVSIGIMANLHLDKNNYIEQLKYEADEQIRYILLRMSKRIVQEVKDYDGSCFDRLNQLISQAKSMSIENEKNMLVQTTYDKEYIRMRSKQTQVLYEMYKLIRMMHTTPFTAHTISTFLEKIASEYHKDNDCLSLLDEFSIIDMTMKSVPLPVERNEFEDRARLFTLLRLLEEFLLIKHDFYENITKKTIV